MKRTSGHLSDVPWVAIGNEELDKALEVKNEYPWGRENESYIAQWSAFPFWISLRKSKMHDPISSIYLFCGVPDLHAFALEIIVI